MTDRGPGTQDLILLSIVARLRERITEFNESTCFLSDHEVPSSWPPGATLCTVCMGDGQFPPEFFDGGGVDTVTKSTVVRITPWVRSFVDKTPHVVAAMVGAREGLVSRFEPRILRALLCHEKDGATVAWEISDDDGTAVLRNQLYPISTSKPAFDKGEKYLGMTITFGITFDWKL